MLGKVLKYDLKSMGKSLFPLYAGLIIMAIALRIVSFITDNFTFLDFIYNIMFVFFIILLVGGLFYTFFVAVIRYYKNLYSDEGYLTHTLPVGSGSLLLSKVIASLIYMIISAFVSFVALIIVIDINEVINILRDAIEFMSMCFDISTPIIITFVVLLFVISYINYMLMVYAGISLGNMHSKNKITFSVIYTIVLYYVSQVISLILLVILFIVNPDIMSQLDKEIPDPEYFIQIMTIGLGINLALSIVYYYICHNRLKHLNLS